MKHYVDQDYKQKQSLRFVSLSRAPLSMWVVFSLEKRDTKPNMSKHWASWAGYWWQLHLRLRKRPKVPNDLSLQPILCSALKLIFPCRTVAWQNTWVEISNILFGSNLKTADFQQCWRKIVTHGNARSRDSWCQSMFHLVYSAFCYFETRCLAQESKKQTAQLCRQGINN